MSDAGAPFLTPDPKQPDLLPVPAEPSGALFTAMESRGEFTGERLYRERPDTYKAVVVLLGQKMGVIRIGQLLGVSPNTVMAVRDREGAAVDIVKEHLARVAMQGATIASEGLTERLQEILANEFTRRGLDMKALKDLAVIYGILNQNGQLLAGQPTSRTEVVELRPEHDDWNQYIASLGSANPLTGEKTGAKRGAPLDVEAVPAADPAAPAPGPAALAPAEPTPPQADSVSEGLPPKPQQI